ncbi:MAG: M1 family aminopeptidase [Acidobacteriota bacterium]
MKNFLRISLSILLLTSIFHLYGDEKIIENLRLSLQNKDISSYLNLFVEDKIEQEKKWINELIENFDFTEVIFSISLLKSENKSKLYSINAMFQNDFSAHIHVWRLKIIEEKIAEKEIKRTFSGLYRISIPSKKIENAEVIEITHEDINVTFKKAILFWDNLPSNHTALLIYGDGNMTFSPSKSQERHQTFLFFKKETLNTSINWAYIRFPPYFLNEKIKIKDSQPFTPSEQILKRALRVFQSLYPNSFTTINSITNEYLSYIPTSNDFTLDTLGSPLGNFTYLFSSFQEENIVFYEREKHKILCSYSPGDEKIMILFDTEKKKDILHYDIDLKFNPENKFINSRIKIIIKSLEDEFSNISLKLNNSLNILKVADSDGRELFFTRDRKRDTVYIYFAKQYEKDELVYLDFWLRGKLETEKELVDIIQLDEFWDYDENIYLYSHYSLWYPSSSDWDYFTAEIKISLPSGYKCISNGKLIKTDQNVYFWECKKPLKYLTFVVGKLNKYIEFNLNGIPVEVYSSYQSPFPKKISQNTLMEILNFYIEKFGNFPYEKLSIIEKSQKEMGGHSPASIVIINRSNDRKLLKIKDNPVNVPHLDEYFLAHEIAHQWWGACITGKSYKDLWITEGLAQFSSLMFHKKKYGEKIFSDTLKKFSQWTRKKTTSGPVFLGPRIGHYNDDSEAFLSIIYDKSALSLNMLNDLLGNEMFYKILREFLSTFQFSEVSTRNFQNMFEKISNVNLEQFFNLWIKDFILPNIQIVWNQSFKDSKSSLNIWVSQKGKDKFTFPLKLRWKEGNKIIYKIFKIENFNEIFNLETSDKIKKLEINHDNSLPAYIRISKGAIPSSLL